MGGLRIKPGEVCKGYFREVLNPGLVWQGKIKAAASSFLAFNPQLSVVFFDEFPADDKPQASAGFVAGAFTVCNHIHVEKILSHFLIHANSVIFDRNLNRTFRYLPGRYEHTSAP